MLIKIVNWSKFNNPRKDISSTSWFRFQNDFFTDPDFSDLPHDQKWVFPYLLSVASPKMRAEIHVSESLACRVLNIDIATFECAIKHLLDRGIIELVTARKRHVRVTLDRNAHGTDTARYERNETNETNDTSLPSGREGTGDRSRAPYQDFVQAWNDNRGTLSRVDEIPDSLKAKIRARWSQRPDIAYWATCAKKMAASTFCCESNFADFHWLVKNDSNHTKVFAGKYDNRKPGGAPKGFERNSNPDDELAEIEARVRQTLQTEEKL